MMILTQGELGYYLGDSLWDTYDFGCSYGIGDGHGSW